MYGDRTTDDLLRDRIDMLADVYHPLNAEARATPSHIVPNSSARLRGHALSADFWRLVVGRSCHTRRCVTSSPHTAIRATCLETPSAKAKLEQEGHEGRSTFNWSPDLMVLVGWSWTSRRACAKARTFNKS